MWEPKNPTKLISDHIDRVSLKSLVKEYGGTNDTIRAFLIRENQWIPYKIGKANLPEQEVIDLYKSDVSIEQTSKKFNVSTSPIVNILNKHKVRKPNWAKSLPYKIFEQVSDRDLFVSVVKKQISKQKVAKYFEINYDMVVSLYKRHKVDGPQNSGTVRSLLNRLDRNGIPFTKEEFEKQHFKYNKSIYDIAILMGISMNYLRQFIRKWGVKTRDTRISLKFREFRKFSTETIQKLVNETSIIKLHKEFEVSMELLSNLLKERQITIPTRFISQGEKSIGDFIESHNISTERNNRKLIYPYELDIYIPSHKLAIEYCGLYWHSELNNRGKDYHITKLNKCNKKGIRLLTIFEDEYTDHPEIVESKISSILKLNNLPKINARQCIVEEITPQQKRRFLDINHLQGDDISSIKLGLFYNNKLIAIMTFAKPSRSRSSNRIMSQERVWELNRFAVDINFNVRGAAGKLLSHFKKNFQWNEIYSYADKRWSEGNLYYQLGFKYISDTPSNYWYIPKGCYKREYRYKYTKFKLIEQGFNKLKTEQEIMEIRGYTRIWDCGHYKFSIGAKK